MKKYVINFVRQCDVCQRCKEENVAIPGLLQPSKILDQAWEGISMDFIEGLPKSHGKEAILVVVDRFTEYRHFIALTHPYTAEGVSKVFMENVYKLHGLPKDIISDKEKVFHSGFWHTVFKQLHMHLSLSTPYHPQSDGKTERVNKYLETYFKCMIFQRPKCCVK